VKLPWGTRSYRVLVVTVGARDCDRDSDQGWLYLLMRGCDGMKLHCARRER